MEDTDKKYPLREAKGFGGENGANTTKSKNYPIAYAISGSVTSRVLAELKSD